MSLDSKTNNANHNIQNLEIPLSYSNNDIKNYKYNKLRSNSYTSFRSTNEDTKSTKSSNKC